MRPGHYISVSSGPMYGATLNLRREGVRIDVPMTQRELAKLYLSVAQALRTSVSGSIESATGSDPTWGADSRGLFTTWQEAREELGIHTFRHHDGELLDGGRIDRYTFGDLSP